MELATTTIKALPWPDNVEYQLGGPLDDFEERVLVMLKDGSMVSVEPNGNYCEGLWLSIEKVDS